MKALGLKVSGLSVWRKIKLCSSIFALKSKTSSNLCPRGSCATRPTSVISSRLKIAKVWRSSCPRVMGHVQQSQFDDMLYGTFNSISNKKFVQTERSFNEALINTLFTPCRNRCPVSVSIVSTRQRITSLLDFSSKSSRSSKKKKPKHQIIPRLTTCLLYTSPSPRDRQKSRMPSSA